MRAMILVLALVLLGPPAMAQQVNNWISAKGTGCRIYNPFPDPGESVTWSGGCRNGLAHGRGRLQWYGKDGKPVDHFDGEFVDGKRQGHGIYFSRGGYRYDGEYREDLPNGYGVATYDSGERFEGQWRNSKPNGQGTLRMANGKTYSGVWQNGCLQQGGHQLTWNNTAKGCGFE